MLGELKRELDQAADANPFARYLDVKPKALKKERVVSGSKARAGGASDEAKVPAAPFVPTHELDELD